ncbi:MAG: hypothetical protein QOJ26_380 [Thermoplasmata archaeon]|jgi:hypothetical protein|nr:hypothetical protein [Thermoplasmata archaeon]MEA3165523.1 hypothetical protein [Thermoplasmata archaeon]
MTNLESRYDNLFGTKTSKGQLYGGFFLLIAGIVLGVAALILFFIAYNNDGASVYNWRKGALTAGAAAGILLFFGPTVSLPTKTGMRILSYVGTGLCVLATVLFFFHYPNHFNVQDSKTGQADYTGLDLLIYAGGLALLVATLFTSLIGYYLGRLQPVGVTTEDEVDDETYGPGYEVPDWVVERDIEYAMKKYGVSWGDGKGSGTSNLNVNVADAVGGNFVVGGLGKARTVQLDSEQVDAGVKGLSTVRPSKKPSLPGEWADQSVASLKALRNKQSAGGASGDAVLPKAARAGFWTRFWNALTGRNNRGNTGGKNGGVGPGKLSKADLNPVQPPANLPKKGKTVVIPDEK